MANNDINLIADELLMSINEDLLIIQQVLSLKLNNLMNKINNLSNKDKDALISIIINKQLEKLKTITKQQYNKAKNTVENITDYFVGDSDDYYTIIDDGDYIADQLLFKVIDNKLELPIDISMIAKYGFSCNLKEEQYYDTLVWIILRYASMNLVINKN